MPKSSGKAAKKPRGRPFPKGISGNPKGRPLKGESFAEIVREVGAMSGNELADVMSNAWAPELRREISSVRMKDALIVRAFLAFFREPTGSMFNAITDRAEGRPAQPLTGAEGGPIEITDARQRLEHLVARHVERAREDQVAPARG